MKEIRIPVNVVSLQTVDSTNSYASRLMQHEPVPEGTVILAGYQTKGRGQRNTSWESDANKNLLLTIVLKPDFLEATHQFYLSMSVSNGIREFLLNYTRNVYTKWPNDLYINNRKIGGILIENTLMGGYLYNSIVGIGLNINQHKFSMGILNPTSLLLETGREYMLEELFNELLRNVSKWINKLYAESWPEIKTAYLNGLLFMNQWINFSDRNGPFEGRIADVAESGELIIKKQNGDMQLYAYGEIRFPS
jgi:BirA family biotin operon repressor/biotin-[acetyl-CoA-carboxylase] ligase